MNKYTILSICLLFLAEIAIAQPHIYLNDSCDKTRITYGNMNIEISAGEIESISLQDSALVYDVKNNIIMLIAKYASYDTISKDILYWLSNDTVMLYLKESNPYLRLGKRGAKLSIFNLSVDSLGNHEKSVLKDLTFEFQNSSFSFGFLGCVFEIIYLNEKLNVLKTAEISAYPKMYLVGILYERNLANSISFAYPDTSKLYKNSEESFGNDRSFTIWKLTRKRFYIFGNTSYRNYYSSILKKSRIRKTNGIGSFFLKERYCD